MAEKMVIETINGEKLIGEICDPKDEFYKQMMKQNILSKEMIPPGVWLLRRMNENGRAFVSFIAEKEIAVKRKATVFDKEVTIKH